MNSSPTEPAPTSAVTTDGTTRAARRAARRRHPHVAVRAAVRRRRGLSEQQSPPTSTTEVLDRLVSLPISLWTYGYDHVTVRHLGPMSQDFARAFGLGDDDRRINLVDANGVVMAACQALFRRLVEAETRLAALEAAGSGADGTG